MATNIVMPRLGLAMEEGTIVKWLKDVGDHVEEGEMLLEVQSDKLTMEIESTDSGVLKKILVREGEKAAVNAPIAVIGDADEAVADPEAASAGEMEIKQDAPSAPTAKESIHHAAVERVKATPAAKALARKNNVDLRTVPYTRTRIYREDVENYLSNVRKADSIRTASSEDKLLPFTPARKVTAERMSLSARTTAPVTLMAEAVADAMVAFKARYTDEIMQRTGTKVTYTDILIKLTAMALPRHEACHARYDEDGVHVQTDINIGFGVDTPAGLYVPVIKNADRKGLAEIAAEREHLVSCAKAGTLTANDMTGGCFTITNLGMMGVKYFTPIINVPQTCILGVGKMDEENGRHKIYFSFVFDHRAIDGAPAARCLQDICKFVENPERTIL